jgi:hypothetical protein
MKKLYVPVFMIFVIGCGEDKTTPVSKINPVIDNTTIDMDSLKFQKEVDLSQLFEAKKKLDSIYPIWKARTLDSLKLIENDAGHTDTQNWKHQSRLAKIYAKIELVDWLIDVEKNTYPSNYKPVKDTLEELRTLINKLSNTPPKDWKKKGLIHPLIGYSLITTPAAHVRAIRLDGAFDGYIDGWLDMATIGDDLKVMIKYIDRPDFGSIFLTNNNAGGISVDDMAWGGGGATSLKKAEDYIGYRIIDFFGSSFFYDSLNVFFDKGLIDTSSLSWYKTKMDPDDYSFENSEDITRPIIQALSKTSPSKLALFILSMDMGVTDFNLIDGKNGLHFKMGETIMLKEFGGPSFQRIDGILYFSELDESDNHWCNSWTYYFDEESECFLFNKD